MAVCKQCGANIPRGERYIGNHYKSLSFCSENCYNQFIQQKKQKVKSNPTSNQFVKLKNYINELWNGEVNWMWMTKQIKTMCEDYELTYQELRMVLRYAVIYEDYVVDSQYGLGQFIKFIEPAMKFAENIKENKKKAENLSEEEAIYISPHKQKARAMKEEDWE